MVRFTGGLLLFTALSAAAPPSGRRALDQPEQLVLGTTRPDQPGNPRKLKGRILHITDLHPDPFYKIGADPDSAHPCHRGHGQNRADYFGAATTKCDTPFTLVNATFNWIDQHLKDEIDFVIWTGDSARHDNDEDHPRTNAQVEGLNEFIVSKFVQVFGKPDNVNDPDPTNDFVVPIVPTYGNNDILPHNIFAPGPNRWTKKYVELWNGFVPTEQRHSFARGGWFFTEVIPNRLAVFSLNTLYFFDSNSAVDGCDLKSEPGYEHMEWLRIQLQFLRQRGMKAILIGHVPPARTASKQAWDESCYQRFTLWQRQYRDVIVGNVFGHMNIDHFMFQDVKDLNYKIKIDGIDDSLRGPATYEPNPRSNDDFSATAKSDYLNELRDGWATLPKPPKGVHYEMTEDGNTTIARESKKHKQKREFWKSIGGAWGERFSLSLVSPSVVPNYYPTLRIIEYNLTGLEHDHPAMGAPVGKPAKESDLVYSESVDADVLGHDLESSDGLQDFVTGDDVDAEKKKKRRKKKKKKHGKKKKRPVKPHFPIPKPPSSTSPPGPAYSPQTLTFLSWTQLYSNLTQIHERMSAKFEDKDVKRTPASFGLEADPEWLALARQRRRDNIRDDGQDRAHSQKKAEKYFDYRVEYSTNNDRVYSMPDLTMRSWLDLAERIGRTELKRKSASSSIGEADDVFDEAASPYSEIATTDVVNDESGDENYLLDDDTDDVSVLKRKGRGKLKNNHLWHAFIKRAFVHTKGDSDLEGDFGDGTSLLEEES